MHIPLLLLDADHDALQVLILCLDILLGPGNEHFTGFQDVTRLVFIGDTERNDIEFQEVLHKIAGSAHVEHFQEPLFGGVNTVLRPPLPLGNPDRSLP